MPNSGDAETVGGSWVFYALSPRDVGSRLDPASRLERMINY